MSDEPENFVLVYLRRLDAKMDRLIALARDEPIPPGLQLRVDRIGFDIERIERCLDLREAHP